MLTQTQREQRARKLARMAKDIEGLPRNARAEVGLRTHTVSLAQPPTTESECWHPDDDLWGTVPIRMWARENRAYDGEIIHLYLWQPGEFGELVNVVTGWIGTRAHEPMLVSVPGSTIGLPWS